MRSVGIVGGVGPGATSWIYLELMKRVTQRDPTRYPLVHIYSLPLRLEIERAFVHGTVTLADEEELVARTITAVRALRDQGAEMILIPCNTIHLYLDEVRRHADGVTVADMPLLAAARVRSGVRTLVLCTSTSRTRFLYGPERSGNMCSGIVYPTVRQQAAIDALIDDCIRSPKIDPWPALTEIIGHSGETYEDVLLACTDLCTISPSVEQFGVINSLSELVDFAVNYVCGDGAFGVDRMSPIESRGLLR